MKPKNETCEERIDRNLKSREADFLKFMNKRDDDETRTEFWQYGLSFDFVDKKDLSWREKESYYRYQLSWGGPSDEIRFYKNRVDYVFMDWFDYADKDITHKDWVKWLVQDFQELEMMSLKYGGQQ